MISFTPFRSLAASLFVTVLVSPLALGGCAKATPQSVDSGSALDAAGDTGTSNDSDAGDAGGVCCP